MLFKCSRFWDNKPIDIQRQAEKVFYVKRYSLKFQKIHKKLNVPESLFNKVAGLRPATLLKKRLWHRCFPINFVKLLITPFLSVTVILVQTLTSLYFHDTFCIVSCQFLVRNSCNSFCLKIQSLFDFVSINLISSFISPAAY